MKVRHPKFKIPGKNLRQLKSEYTELLELSSYIPGCAMCCEHDKDFKLLSYNQGFLDMFGYTKANLKDRFDNKFRFMIHEEDLPSLDAAIKQLAAGDILDQEYRVVCEDGTLLWVHDSSNLVLKKDGTKVFYCMIMDISRLKIVEEELRLSLERHKIIMDQTTDIIFEWDIVNDVFDFSPNWEEKFGYTPKREHFRESLLNNFRVHPEDLYAFSGFIEQATSNQTCTKSEFRFARGDEYIWCRIRCTLQQDAEGNAMKIVGVIIDIDEEKQRLHFLQERAARDSLTNLYHKGATQSLVEDSLQCREAGFFCALLLLDIDDFKDINDFFGHPTGDTVLEDIAAFLQGMFRDGDIIGRIGGDEFIILLRNVKELSSVSQKAQAILNAFSAYRNSKMSGISLSCSIGASLAPTDGNTFAQLYAKADVALYRAKEKGKDSFAFYSVDAQSVSPINLLMT